MSIFAVFTHVVKFAVLRHIRGDGITVMFCTVVEVFFI